MEEGKKYQVSHCFLPPIVFPIGICRLLWVAHIKANTKVITGGDDLSIEPLLYCIGLNRNQPIPKFKMFFGFIMQLLLCQSDSFATFDIPDNFSGISTHSFLCNHHHKSFSQYGPKIEKKIFDMKRCSPQLSRPLGQGRVKI